MSKPTRLPSSVIGELGALQAEADILWEEVFRGERDVSSLTAREVDLLTAAGYDLSYALRDNLKGEQTCS